MPDKNPFFATYDESMASPKPRVSCGNVFRTLAVAMIDYLQTHTFIPTTLLPFAHAYFEKYPNRFLSDHTGSLLRQLQSVIAKQQAIDILVTQMADVFYRLTLKGLLRNPTRYHEFALPRETREYPAHWIAQSAPDVIANKLSVILCVHETAFGKPLPALASYGPAASTVRFDLTERHGVYGAYVKETQLFDALTFDDTHPPDDPETLSKLRPELDKAIQVTLARFQTYYDKLRVMAEAGELTKSFLEDLYIDAIDLHINSSTPRNAHGIEDFLRSIEGKEKHTSHLTDYYLRAIAGMLCLGMIEEKALFEQIESPHPTYVF